MWKKRCLILSQHKIIKFNLKKNTYNNQIKSKQTSKQKKRVLFDLNLNNYSIKEIEEIFDLSTYPTYDTTLLDEKTDRLTFFVNQHPTLQDSIRKSTIVFIQNAKSRLQDPKYNAKFNPGQYLLS